MTIQYTANFQLPYPSLDRTDTADVPRDVKALADKVDSSLLIARHDELIGEIKIWPIAAAPDLFLICDGSLIDRVGIYNKLFLAIGTTFGIAGDDGAKFRLPDGRGRAFLGVDGSANRLSVDDALGDYGGKETAPLSIANMPPHAHPDNIAFSASGLHDHSGLTGFRDRTQDHFHTTPVGFPWVAQDHSGIAPGFNPPIVQPAAGATGDVSTRSADAPDHKHTLSPDGSHTHPKSGSVQSAGGGIEHPNLPPYLIANYIIRYA